MPRAVLSGMGSIVDADSARETPVGWEVLEPVANQVTTPQAAADTARHTQTLVSSAAGPGDVPAAVVMTGPRRRRHCATARRCGRNGAGTPLARGGFGPVPG